MVRLVIANLRPARTEHRYIFICLEEHIVKTNLASDLRSWAGDCSILTVPQVTSGAAVTVLTARALIANETQIMIANCDQLVRVDIDRYIETMDSAGADGVVMTMQATDPKWSFVRRNARQQIDLLAEKVPISSEATVGIYNFRTGNAFLAAADAMIQQDLRVNGEFYVAPVYNELIRQGKVVVPYQLEAPDEEMIGLGTPEDIEEFVANPRARTLVDTLSTR